jgi:hypothetical protein
MRSPEITHYSALLADLTIAAARATSVEQLAAIRVETIEAYTEIFSLLSHDALDAHDLAADLIGRLPARVAGSVVHA